MNPSTFNPFYEPSTQKLHPVFVAQKVGDLFCIESFARVPMQIESGYREDLNLHIIGGEVAKLLFVALTGRSHDADPAEASPDLARYARARLRQVAPWPGGYWMASRVLRDWGEFISPSMEPKGDQVRL